MFSKAIHHVVRTLKCIVYILVVVYSTGPGMVPGMGVGERLEKMGVNQGPVSLRSRGIDSEDADATGGLAGINHINHMI